MQNFGTFDCGDFLKIGVKKNFFGGPYPQTGSEFARNGRGVCRAREGVSDSEKFFEKFPRVTEIFGVKEKLLAPPSGKTCTIWVEMEGGMGRGY